MTWAERVWVRRVVPLNAVASVQPGDELDCIDITTSQPDPSQQRRPPAVLRGRAAKTEIRYHPGDKWHGAGMLDRVA
jgi:hypothetical protein